MSRPSYTHSISIETAATGGKSRHGNQFGGSSGGTPVRPDMRVTRSMSREKQQMLLLQQGKKDGSLSSPRTGEMEETNEDNC